MGGKRAKKIGFLRAALLACVFALGGIYIFEANSLIKHQFAQKNMEKDIAALRDEVKQLEIKFSEISSLNNLKELSSALALEEAKDISYIQVKGYSPLGLGN